jgi:hypothetical protein
MISTFDNSIKDTIELTIPKKNLKHFDQSIPSYIKDIISKRNNAKRRWQRTSTSTLQYINQKGIVHIKKYEMEHVAKKF